MARKSLHPSVEQFKSFVKKHPKLLKSVRNGENTWQEVYEDWYLLGADDPKWNSFKDAGASEETAVEKTETDKGWMNQITGIIKKMDANQVQNHIQQLSQAIGAIQGVLGQFQGGIEQKANQPPSANTNPFSFKKD
ncbi:YlbD family protein [Lederbergia citrea]|uniref:YlbD family protein n=1 Tax=Lederbergia citrea TaxID=2833581 RepID=A0A942UIY0_9BACI|nr:YlbD family protein [Lederbergia citrea]MBS4203905.1 YlbD family protein [Lederbergia citrea]MBS4221510.1 YlbD family protein [Lederbergia citrea]